MPPYLVLTVITMNRTEFEHLAEKFLNGNISQEEEKLLTAHYDALQEEKGSWNQNYMGVQDEVKAHLYSKVLDEIAKYEKLDRQNKGGNIFFYWKAAAVFIAIVSAVLFFYVKPLGVPTVKNNKPDLVNHDILPGGNKAVLTLADGSQITLDSTRTGAINAQGNIIIDKNKDGELVYRIAESNHVTEEDKLVYNTISTPVTGQYQIVLSDDTRVWLNAKSSIKFPIAFTSHERRVEIEGEAYFEVTRDKKKPFKVYSGNQVVEVLGTHFNVNAYEDEEEIKTTLLEGAVKISSGKLNRLLKPGQQARLSGRTGEMHIVKVDMEEAVSWKNGYFIFDNEDIRSVMRKISRWYGVEVVYTNEQISENFGGTVSKFENVSQVLKILEATGTIHFKIEGRRIIVMQ
jgi:transmembrane sensor